MEQKAFNYLLLVALLGTMGVTWGITGYTLVSVSGGVGGIGGYQIDPVFISISGSTTCFPVIEECANEYMTLYPWYDIRVSSGGSTTGVNNAALDVSDIGMASRPIKSSEFTATPTLIQWGFASDGIGVIFDAGATHGLTQLNISQVFLIYNGTYDTWDDLGSVSTAAINVVTRASGSGTRASFEELVQFGGEELGDNAGYIANVPSYTTYGENPSVAAAVAADSNAIGYVGLAFIDAAQHINVAISDDGGVSYFPATPQNVKDGLYPISRKLYLVTNGMPTAPIMAFMDFVFGPSGQKITEDEGFVSILDITTAP